MQPQAGRVPDVMGVPALVELLDRMRNVDGNGELAEFLSRELAVIADNAGRNRTTVRRLWQSLLESCSLSVQRGARIGELAIADAATFLGERFAADGWSPTECLDMLLALRRLAMEAFRRLARAAGHDAGLVARGMAHISQSMSQFMVELNRGHLKADIDIQARRRMEQDVFVWQALTGTSPGGDDFLKLDAYGLDSTALYHAFRTRLCTTNDVAILERYLGLETEDRRKTGMTIVMDGDVCGFTTRLPANDPPILVGVSEAVPFTELPNAFRRATRAFNVAQHVGLSGLQSLESLGLLASVIADKEIGAVLTETYLTPMYKLGEYGEALLDTVRAYISNDCQLETTAQLLNLHINTVRYRIAKFEEILGISLRDTSTLADVWWALNLPIDWSVPTATFSADSSAA